MASLSAILRNVAASSFIALGCKMVSIPLGYFTLVIIARLLGAEQMGTFAIATSMVATLSVCCRLGLDTGLLRFFSNMQADGKGDLLRLFKPALGLALTLSCLGGGLVYCLGDWLALRFHAPNLPLMIVFVILALPTSVASALCSEALRALGGVRWVVFCQDFLASALLMGLVAGLAYDGSFLVPAQQLGLALWASMAIPLGLLGFVLRAYAKPLKNVSTPDRFKNLLSYSMPLFLSSLLMLAFGSLDGLILGFCRPPESVAYYEAAAKSSILISLPLIAVNAAVPPLFAQFFRRGDLTGLEAMARTTSRWIYYLALPLALLALAAAPDLLELFGSGFSAGDTALRLLALGQLVNVACGSVGFILAMTGHQVILTKMLALAGVVGIPLMTLGAALYGLTGLAAAKSLWLVGVNVLMSLGVWKHLKIKVFACQVGWAHLAGLAGLACFLFAKPLLGWPGGAAAFCFGYGVFMLKTVRQEIGGLMHHPQWEALK